jgi:acyl carrier protein
MHNAETTHRIRRVIAQTGSLLVDPASLSRNDDLYAAGLKSLAAVHLMLALEAEFGIEFPASALHRTAFSTIGRIDDLVESLAPRAAAAARN